MISERSYKWVLVFLIVVRIIMVLALMQGFPYIQERDKGWYVHSVPAYETESFRLAKSLAGFRPVGAYIVLGFPLFLVPLIWIFKAKVIEDILLPVTIFYSIFLFGISILLVASIAKKLSNENKKVALVSAGLWTILPYLAYLTVLIKPHLSCIDIAQKRTFYLMWATLLDDPLYSFLIILGVYTFITALKHKDKIFYSILVGILFGFASLVNPLTCALIGVSFLLTFLFMKYLRAFIYSTITFAVFSIPQLIHNWHFNGSPFKLLGMSPQIALVYQGKTIPFFSFSNIIFSINRILERFHPTNLWLFSTLFLSLLISAIYILKKKDDSKILVIWAAPHLFYITSYCGFSFCILECILSILPAIIIMFSMVIVDITRYSLNLLYKATSLRIKRLNSYKSILLNLLK